MRQKVRIPKTKTTYVRHSKKVRTFPLHPESAVNSGEKIFLEDKDDTLALLLRESYLRADIGNELFVAGVWRHREAVGKV